MPDFRVSDDEKWAEIVQRKLCQLCGQPLGVNIFFIGGPLSYENRLFYDPAMHLDCGRYALAVCPYMTRINWAYSQRELPPGAYKVEVVNEPSRERPDKIGFMRTHGYKTVPVRGRTLIMADPFDQVEWID